MHVESCDMQPCARPMASVHGVKFNWRSWRSKFNARHLSKLKVRLRFRVLIPFFSNRGRAGRFGRACGKVMLSFGSFWSKVCGYSSCLVFFHILEVLCFPAGSTAKGVKVITKKQSELPTSRLVWGTFKENLTVLRGAVENIMG